MKVSQIEISNPDKIFFPEARITKLEVVKYYDKIADRMLPFLEDRPLTLQRFPDGIHSDGFYQKNTPEYFPDFIETVSIETEEGMNTQVICNSKKSLIYLANQGTISFHTWLSQKDELQKPDKVVFDLDPPRGAFKKLKEATQIIGDFLHDNGLEPQLMTSGIRGFHIWHAVNRDKNFDDRREEVKNTAEKLEKIYPKLLTTEIRKSKRNNRIFVDYLRNAYGQTSVCPFSLRAAESVGIATPLDWGELPLIDTPDQYHITNIFRRLGQKDN